MKIERTQRVNYKWALLKVFVDVVKELAREVALKDPEVHEDFKERIRQGKV